MAACHPALLASFCRSQGFDIGSYPRIDDLTHSGRQNATALTAMPGIVFVPATASGLPRDSVVTVTGMVTVYEDDLIEMIGQIPSYLQAEVDQGLRRVLDL